MSELFAIAFLLIVFAGAAFWLYVLPDIRSAVNHISQGDWHDVELDSDDDSDID